VLEAFAFVDGGRTFRCVIEKARGARSEAWWWFSVSSDENHRYAPFRADAGDTHTSVQTRIVAFYDGMLERRAQPAVNPWRRGRPAAKREPTA